MTGIQVVLIILLLLILAYTVSKLRSRKTDLLILGFMVVAGIALVLMPDYTIWLAKKLGVGRGADLIFYLSILAFWYVILRLYIRIRKLEQAVTAMVRQQSLDNASKQ